MPVLHRSSQNVRLLTVAAMLRQGLGDRADIPGSNPFLLQVEQAFAGAN